MSKSILVRVTADEDYDDVSDELLFCDFEQNAGAFKIELMSKGEWMTDYLLHNTNATIGEADAVWAKLKGSGE